MEEVKVLKQLNNENIVKILDTFFIHDKHACLVMEIMGQNMLSFYQFVHSLQLNNLINDYMVSMIKVIGEQILSSLDYMHRKCRLIHTDIKPENILFSIDKETIRRIKQELIVTKESQHLLRKSEPIVGDENIRFKECVSSGKKGEYRHFLSTVKVKLADFGNACYIDNLLSGDIQTRQYRAPEIIVGYSWNESVDIWSVGCVLFEILTGDYLFDPKTSSHFSKEEDHLALIIELLGPYPTKIIQRAKHSHKYFDRYSKYCLYLDKLRHIKELDYWDIYSVLVEKYKISRDTARILGPFFEQFLVYDPRKRPSARKILSHEFLNTL